MNDLLGFVLVSLLPALAGVLAIAAAALGDALGRRKGTR